MGINGEVLQVTQPPGRSPSPSDAPGMRSGYKSTEFGVIPEDWLFLPVRRMGEVLTGKALAVNAPGQQRPYLRTKNVFDGRIDVEDVLTMPMTDTQFQQFRIFPGDVLLNEGQSLELVGRCAIYRGEYPGPCAIQNQLLRFRAKAGVSAEFSSHLFRYCQQAGIFTRIALQTTSMAHLGGSRFEGLLLPWPEKEEEQRGIAEALSDADKLIDSLDKLIAKKRAIKLATVQQLLTGKTRLAGFTGEWKTRIIADIANPYVERNSSALELPVLACSKHLGFVDSLRYFKNQVFSQDLSGYKLIRRGQLGYPSNHVEEGSIGLQDLYDVALVSPIYVVFAPVEGVNSFFLHSLLKLDAYRQKFATATNSSVDRRGSLKWHAFSQITVTMPPTDEQVAIAVVLSDMDDEIAAVERRREKTKAIKQGMMQELLTGRIRFV